jgi:hypothetical protein
MFLNDLIVQLIGFCLVYLMKQYGEHQNYIWLGQNDAIFIV